MVEQGVVQFGVGEAAGDARFHPVQQSARPVLVRELVDLGLLACGEVAGEAVLEGGEQLSLGPETQVEGAFGDLGAGGHLVDGQAAQALVEHGPAGGVQQVAAASFRSFGALPHAIAHRPGACAGTTDV